MLGVCRELLRPPACSRSPPVIPVSPKSPKATPKVLGHVGSTALRGWQRSSLLGGFLVIKP